MKNGVIEEDYFYGCKALCWYCDDKLHREDGPAIEWANGTKFWYYNGVLHREDGPAVEDIDGSRRWFLNGKIVNCSSQREFDRLIKLKAFW